MTWWEFRPFDRDLLFQPTAFFRGLLFIEIHWPLPKEGAEKKQEVFIVSQDEHRSQKASRKSQPGALGYVICDHVILPLILWLNGRYWCANTLQSSGSLIRPQVHNVFKLLILSTSHGSWIIRKCIPWASKEQPFFSLSKLTEIQFFLYRKTHTK